MKFVLEIEVDNAAFQGWNLCHEIKRIVEEINPVEMRECRKNLAQLIRLRDVNGNTVGTAQFVETKES